MIAMGPTAIIAISEYSYCVFVASSDIFRVVAGLCHFEYCFLIIRQFCEINIEYTSSVVLHDDFVNFNLKDLWFWVTNSPVDKSIKGYLKIMSLFSWYFSWNKYNSVSKKLILFVQFKLSNLVSSEIYSIVFSVFRRVFMINIWFSILFGWNIFQI